jgi:hypothetical protein
MSRSPKLAFPFHVSTHKLCTIHFPLSFPVPPITLAPLTVITISAVLQEPCSCTFNYFLHPSLGLSSYSPVSFRRSVLPISSGTHRHTQTHQQTDAQHTLTQNHTPTHTQPYTHTPTLTPHIHPHTPTYTQPLTHTHSLTHTPIHNHTPTQTQLHTLTPTHPHIHTPTHTHTRTHGKPHTNLHRQYKQLATRRFRY